MKTVSEYRPQVVTATDTAVDTNTAATTTALPLLGATKVGMFLEAASGTHATCVITLQLSQDGTVWNNTPTTLQGVGMVQFVEVVGHSVRVLVTTLEGGLSTSNIILIANN